MSPGSRPTELQMPTQSTTVVVQSFRTHDVPGWIQDCIRTVKAWAEQSGFAYKMTGDEFLELPPAWYREKAAQHITVVTDLARLLLVRQCFTEGFDRVIWIDADMVIFSPGLLSIDPELSFGYCREVWVERIDPDRVDISPKINNAACLFRNNAPARAHLNEYMNACLSIVANVPRIEDHTEVGTRYLTSMHSQSPLAILTGFGLLSPAMIYALLNSEHELLMQFMKSQGGPIYAANLCNFFRTVEAGFARVPDSVYSAVVKQLIGTEGRILNEFSAC